MRQINIAIYLVFPALILGLILGCSNNNSIMGSDPNSMQNLADVPISNPRTNLPTIKTTGTVEYISLEGGFWGIVADDNAHYEPTNLSPKFMQKGLHVQFTATISKVQHLTPMWGIDIDIINMSTLPTNRITPGGTNHP